MESSTPSWVQDPNICRCCLSMSSEKELAGEYYHCGKREVYKEMLQETFNIKITPMLVRDSNDRICDNCIQMLRDAYSFKHMVSTSLQTVSEYFSKNCSTGRGSAPEILQALPMDISVAKVEPPGEANSTSQPKNTPFDISIVKEEVVVEITPEECGLEEFFQDGFIGMEMVEDDDSDDLGDDDKEDDEENDDDDEDSSLSAEEESSDDDECPLDRLKKLPGVMKHITKDLTEKLDYENTSKNSVQSDDAPILRENSLKVFANSTIFPFQWYGNKFYCFICSFTTNSNVMQELSLHSRCHTVKEIDRKIRSQNNLRVKVDITIMRCKKCRADFQRLSDLKYHLTKFHDVIFKSDEDLLVPFRITPKNLECTICNIQFPSFKVLNVHVNKHFTKESCDVCGKSFSEKSFFNAHVVECRKNGGLKCKECDRIFSNNAERRRHMKEHAKLKKKQLQHPCLYCKESFATEKAKIKHLVEEHGVKKSKIPRFSCEVCSKSFLTKKLLNIHVKGAHK